MRKWEFFGTCHIQQCESKSDTAIIVEAVGITIGLVDASASGMCLLESAHSC